MFFVLSLLQRPATCPCPCPMLRFFGLFGFVFSPCLVAVYLWSWFYLHPRTHTCKHSGMCVEPISNLTAILCVLSAPFPFLFFSFFVFLIALTCNALCPVGGLMSNVYCCIFYDGAILFSALSDKFNEFYFRIYVCVRACGILAFCGGRLLT